VTESFLTTFIIRDIQGYESETGVTQFETYIEWQPLHSQTNTLGASYLSWIYGYQREDIGILAGTSKRVYYQTEFSLLNDEAQYYVIQRCTKVIADTDVVIFALLLIIAIYSPLSVIVRIGLLISSKCKRCNRKEAQEEMEALDDSDNQPLLKE